MDNLPTQCPRCSAWCEADDLYASEVWHRLVCEPCRDAGDILATSKLAPDRVETWPVHLIPPTSHYPWRDTVRLAAIRPGDIIEADVKGRRFLARVVTKNDTNLAVDPIPRNITHFSVRAREVIAHWQRRGR